MNGCHCPGCLFVAPNQIKLLIHRLEAHQWRPHFYRGESGPFRVMTVKDGYAMARYPRCTPFVLSYRELLDHLGGDVTNG